MLQTFWCQIPQHTLRGLVEVMPQWVKAVLAAKPTQWWSYVMPDHCIIQYSYTNSSVWWRARHTWGWWLEQKYRRQKTVNTASLSLHPYDHNSIISSVCIEPTVQSTPCTQVCCLFPYHPNLAKPQTRGFPNSRHQSLYYRFREQ